MKKKLKRCKQCHQDKAKKEFSYEIEPCGRHEFCFSCKQKFPNHVLITNKENVILDTLTQQEADVLLLHDILIYRKHRYEVIDSSRYLEYSGQDLLSYHSPADNILAIGKYDEKRKSVSKGIATQLVKEEAAVWESDQTIRYLFSGKELEQFVVKRDNEICYHCQKKGDRITFQLSRTKGGLLSPFNSVCSCKSCKDAKGENLYFYKWLNIPIINEQTIDNNLLYTLIEKRKQTSFAITKDIAFQLIEEGMAELVHSRVIKTKYDQHDFRDFILTRDNYTCFYCHRYGDTVDHLHPQAFGGLTTPKNCVCACENCNGKKGHTPLDTFQKKRKK